MVNIGKWNTPGTLVTALSSVLTNLSSGSIATSSTAIANASNLDIYADIEVVLSSTGTFASGAYVSIYALESVDGTNFPAQSAADLRLTSNQLLVVIPIGVTASSTQRVVARQVVLPPANFQVVLDNQTGAPLNSGGGNTVKFLPYDLNLNG